MEPLSPRSTGLVWIVCDVRGGRSARARRPGGDHRYELVVDLPALVCSHPCADRRAGVREPCAGAVNGVDVLRRRSAVCEGDLT